MKYAKWVIFERSYLKERKEGTRISAESVEMRNLIVNF